MAYYFVHPLRDNDRDLSTYNYDSYPEHDNDYFPNKVDINSKGEYSTGGNKVVSMTNGVVLGAGMWSRGDGYVVIHTEEAAYPVTKIRYVHLNTDTLQVQSGDEVTKGQLIGYVAREGEPGYGTARGSHLHIDFGISDNESTDFENFPPLSSDDLKVTTDDYDIDIYNQLCELRGVPNLEDDPSQFYWSYMLWAQKPESFDNQESSTLKGRTVDCTGDEFQPQEGIFINLATAYVRDWAQSSNQYRVYQMWDSQGESLKWDNHIATYGNENDRRYLVAVVTGDESFGHVGDKIDIVLGNGVIIPAIIADSKGENEATNANGLSHRWGHLCGQNDAFLSIVEFEVSDFNGDTPSDWFGQDVAKIIVGESILGG